MGIQVRRGFVLIFYYSILVRQTLDPFVDDVQYIAYCEVILERNGDLRINKLGFGKPGDEFLVRRIFNIYHHSNQMWQQIALCEPWGAQSIPVVGLFCPGPTGTVLACDITSLVSSEGGRYSVLTIVGTF